MKVNTDVKHFVFYWKYQHLVYKMVLQSCNSPFRPKVFWIVRQFWWLLEEIFDGIKNMHQYEEYEKIAPLVCCFAPF